MNDIHVLGIDAYGKNFIPAHMRKGDEYEIRNKQLKRPLTDFRPLRADEIAILEKNGNTATDWSQILVVDPFTPELIRNSSFAGLVRIGKLETMVLEHHELEIPTGITNSRIIACDIGDNCEIHSCSYIAHYSIGDTCILLSNDEIHATNHAKWGNGIIKEGEPESVRIWIDVMNENSGRAILPFDGMLSADAWLWAKRRYDRELLERLKEITQNSFSSTRGEYGIIGKGCVLKSNRIIKDVKIGEAAYIKGSNKLKNLTINSNDYSRTQIGEGVELVNGIIGYGCKIFYGCKAVRFVMGDNSSLKYGARLIHSVLGDNSTVSCCEILNNLIFPAHEQHHNTSFLIASVVKGQSNIAAGATLGSNHNSRANDGEIEAGRGFWPGLNASIKHSSKFASFCLLAKGMYRYELNIPFPFALVMNNEAEDALEIMPAYWWMYNMYALLRNERKFEQRDTRRLKKQPIEFAALAPDTVEEIFSAMEILEYAVGKSWYRAEGIDLPQSEITVREKGKAVLLGEHAVIDRLDVLVEGVENSDRPVRILKPRKSYKAYRHMIRWYAITALADYVAHNPQVKFDELAMVFGNDRETAWDNLGGQIIPEFKVYTLIQKIKNREYNSWDEIHSYYRDTWKTYRADKAKHAWNSLQFLLGEQMITLALLEKEIEHFIKTANFIKIQAEKTRLKDYENDFRRSVYSDEAEMFAVLGNPYENAFIAAVKEDMDSWIARADAFLERIRNK